MPVNEHITDFRHLSPGCLVNPVQRDAALQNAPALNDLITTESAGFHVELFNSYVDVKIEEESGLTTVIVLESIY